MAAATPKKDTLKFYRLSVGDDEKKAIVSAAGQTTRQLFRFLMDILPKVQHPITKQSEWNANESKSIQKIIDSAAGDFMKVLQFQGTMSSILPFRQIMFDMGQGVGFQKLDDVLSRHGIGVWIPSKGVSYPYNGEKYDELQFRIHPILTVQDISTREFPIEFMQRQEWTSIPTKVTN